MEYTYPTGKSLLKTFGVYLLGFIPTTLILFLIYRGEAGANNAGWSTFLAVVIPLTIATSYAYRRSGRPALFQSSPDLPLRTITAAVVLAFNIGWIASELAQWLPGYAFLQDLLGSVSKNGAGALLALVIAGPVLEEVLFRGIILRGFLQKYSPRQAIIYSAIAFGVMHLHPIQMLVGFAVGIVMGYIYYRTRSLTLVIGVHAFNNLVAWYMIDSEPLVAKIGGEITFGYFSIIFLFALGAYFAYETFTKWTATLRPWSDLQSPVSRRAAAAEV